MPFKLRWPFSWPRRKPAARASPTAVDSSVSVAAGESPAAASAERSSASVQRLRAEPPAPPAGAAPKAAPSTAALEGEPGEGPDLGAELLGRLPSLATPPTLGRLGGLPAMAQTLPTVDRFFQNLPAPPPRTLLPGLGEAGEFAANLPSLVGFTAPAAAGQPPAFPAQLEPSTEPTDILAPPGGMPGQISGLSGAAPVLEPARPAPITPQVVVPASVAATPVPTPAPSAPIQRAQEAERLTAAAPTALVSGAAPATGVGAPAAAQPAAPKVVTPVTPTSAVAPLAGPMTKVLPLAQTLTGNVLPGLSLEGATGEPVQRELSRSGPAEWQAPDELVRPPEATGERLTPTQREAIESQRGQGQPLEPKTQQRFEQAYGQPLDSVRVHTGPTAHATAESLNAIAFASGTDLFFTQSSYAPDNPQGLSLIGHELAHVIQQQYGVAGDADALRPPDDRYEQQADQLAARALETPLAGPSHSEGPAAGHEPIQRAQSDDLRLPGSAPIVPSRPPTLPAASTWAPGEQLAKAANASPQPLASPLAPAGVRPEDEPVQRFSAASARPTPRVAAGAAANTADRAAASPSVAVTSATLPSLERAPQRLGSLTEQLLSPATMLSHSLSLSQNLPGLGVVYEAGQALPVFRSMRLGLPGMSSLPDLSSNLPALSQSNLPDVSSLGGQMPNVPSLPSLPGLGGGAPAMPDLGSVAQGLGGEGLPSMPGLASLAGLKPSAMPLAEGLGGLGQAAGQAAGEAASGTMAAGQQALGTVNSMGPGEAEAPAAPPLPSLDKLTEHVWKEIQHKLKVERERSRGLA